jgi:hypothetical protein
VSEVAEAEAAVPGALPATARSDGLTWNEIVAAAQHSGAGSPEQQAARQECRSIAGASDPTIHSVSSMDRERDHEQAVCATDSPGVTSERGTPHAASRATTANGAHDDAPHGGGAGRGGAGGGRSSAAGAVNDLRRFLGTIQGKYNLGTHAQNGAAAPLGAAAAPDAGSSDAGADEADVEEPLLDAALTRGDWERISQQLQENGLPSMPLTVGPHPYASASHSFCILPSA